MNDKYLENLKNANLFFYGPTKGSFILPPEGYFIWQTIQDYFNKKFFDLNISNVYLPSIIPIELIEKEKKHIDGFSPEFFYITKKEKDVYDDNNYSKTVLRPTSEVLFHYWYKKILFNYKQLPFLYNQWCSVFRSEKNTYPFFRNSEFLWQEGHTLHETEKEAKDMVLKIFELYKKYFQNFLLLPIVFGKKSEKEKFAGAIESYTIEFILSNGYFLQLATVHFFSDFFCKAIGVNFQNYQNESIIPFSTSWGTSTRSIGALADFHSDKNGIFFPSELSPIQISIITTKNEEKIESFCNKIFKLLSSKKYRAKIYCNYKKNFSSRLYDSDKEGSLFKLIIGEKEIENNYLTLIDRLNNKFIFSFEKENKFSENFIYFIENKIKETDEFIFKNSRQNMNINVIEPENINDLKKKIEFVENKSEIFSLYFCNNLICENNISSFVPFYNIRCIIDDEKDNQKKCFFCGNYGSFKSYFGKSY